jgi:hypothetical protein
MWTGWEAFNNTRTDADGAQLPRYSRVSTMDDNVLCRCANQRWQTLYANKLTYINLELDISLGSVHSLVHDQMDNRKMCAGLVSRNLMVGHKVPHSLTHATDTLCQSMGVVLEHAVIGNTKWILWDLIQKKIHDKATPITSSSKETQSHATGKGSYGKCLLRTCRCAWAYTNNQTWDDLCCYGQKVMRHPLILQPVFSIPLDLLKRLGWQVICN